MNVTKQIELIVNKIALYSDRDMVRVTQLESELKVLQAQLLDEMTEQNEAWLLEQMVRIEA